MYQEIYVFNVEDAIKNGQFVRLIDKAQGTISPVNTMPVGDFYKLLSEAAGDKNNRYMFYVRNEEKDDAD